MVPEANQTFFKLREFTRWLQWFIFAYFATCAALKLLTGLSVFNAWTLLGSI